MDTTIADRGRLTLYETPSCPLDLRSDDDLRRGSARPHDTGPCFDGEYTSTGYVRGSCRRDCDYVVFEITEYRFVSYLAFRLLRPEGSIEWFYV